MTTNHQQITAAFQILTEVLGPYIAQELGAKFEGEWWSKGVLGVLRDHQRRDLPTKVEGKNLVEKLDAALCLLLVDLHWESVFKRKLSRQHRNWVKELMTTRNTWAHKGSPDMASEDAWRALDTMTRLIEKIDPAATERLRELARTVRYGTEGPSTSVKKDDVVARSRSEDRGATAISKVSTREGLLPWREVVRPHPDVAAGRYRQAEFAADLAQVVRGTAEVEYQDPVEFFARTYLTEGISRLMLQALHRMNGKGGDPIVQLKTTFGGGKTHSLLALYHLFRGHLILNKLPQVASLCQEAGIKNMPQVRVAVVVGTAINPTKESRPRNLPGITIRTLWGEIGAQLAEQAGDTQLYNYVRDADRKGVPPGSEALRSLFDACGPCLILVDELVAYVRKIYGAERLPAGSFAAALTFIQELTEAVRASKNTLLVATIPESDIEVGGQAGLEVLEHIEHTFGRMEAIWKPVGSEEGFEVVRRRLFLRPDQESARDDVCRAFSEMYRSTGDFPIACKEARYLERMKACYPIHPEVFERLYNDWAALDRFQRTRGVLRLMAAVIHDLWVRNDTSLMIMPGSLGLDIVAVREELVRYLPEGWAVVLESDVDGQNSVPFRLDAENQRFGQSAAGRRVARSIFLGSAPHVAHQQVRGLEDVRVRLAVAQPGEQVSVFNDALSQLAEKLTYLYRRDRRYWYDTRPNLRRTVEERAQQISDAHAESEIIRRLQKSVPRENDGFAGVHVCPVSSGDVSDEQEARLVILRLSQTHKGQDMESEGIKISRSILVDRSGNSRQNRNMLVFLAPAREATENLQQEVKRYLAWCSVVSDQDALNLDAHQRREAREGEKESGTVVGLRLNETYRWLLVPIQRTSEHRAGSLDWEAASVTGINDVLVRRISQHMREKDHLIARWSPALLKLELDRWFWKEEKHVSVKSVWDSLCAFCYLPRLRNQTVFTQAIQEGVASGDYFGYATSVSTSGRYEGLQLGVGDIPIYVDGASVLVRLEVAKEQIEREKAEPKPEPEPPPGSEGPSGDPKEPKLPHRFTGVSDVDPDRAIKAMGEIAEEVLQHLTILPRSEVSVTVEIEARVPDGVPEGTQRTVKENCRTLRFKVCIFE